MKGELRVNAPSGIDVILNNDDIAGELGKLQEEDLADTRFLMVIGIRNNGSVYYRRVGYITGLELDGLKISVESLCDITSGEVFGDGE